MTDIVERLRASAATWIEHGGSSLNLHADAADEIERLRADLKESNEAVRELQQAACDREGVPMPSQRPVVERLQAALRGIRAKSAQMAEDDGLWFGAATAAEAYLQSELRKLCAVIEDVSPDECARAAYDCMRAGKAKDE